MVVHTRSREVLLLRRRRPAADYWQSVTGSLLDGETPAAAARRELWEETGIRPARSLADCRQTNRFPIAAEWRHRYDPRVRENTEHVFRLELEVPCPVRLAAEEHVDYAWMPAARAARRASSSTNRAAIRRLLEERR